MVGAAAVAGTVVGGLVGAGVLGTTVVGTSVVGTAVVGTSDVAGAVTGAAVVVAAAVVDAMVGGGTTAVVLGARVTVGCDVAGDAEIGGKVAASLDTGTSRRRVINRNATTSKMIATMKLKIAPTPKSRFDGRCSSTGKSIVGATWGIGAVSHRSASWTTMGGRGSGATVATAACSTGSRRDRWSWTCSILVLGDWVIGLS
jgi:hypothetical protein